MPPCVLLNSQCEGRPPASSTLSHALCFRSIALHLLLQTDCFTRSAKGLFLEARCCRLTTSNRLLHAFYCQPFAHRRIASDLRLHPSQSVSHIPLGGIWKDSSSFAPAALALKTLRGQANPGPRGIIAWGQADGEIHALVHRPLERLSTSFGSSPQLNLSIGLTPGEHPYPLRRCKPPCASPKGKEKERKERKEETRGKKNSSPSFDNQTLHPGLALEE